MTELRFSIRASRPVFSIYTSVIVVWACLSAFVSADCECGYSSTINSTTYVFSDLIETDFLHLSDIAADTDWIRQSYNVTAQASRGTYGTYSQIENVISNAVLDPNSFVGPSKLGGDAGLGMYVRGGIPASVYVPIAEVDSARTDLLWGSYRAALKMTNQTGTCSAFFWYFNDSQEIDMEFLSSDFDASTKSFPVNLVLQSAQSAAQGFSSASSGDYKVANLPFDPRTGFHEYRIDFVPGVIVFYADGQFLASMATSAVPSMPGHLILTQWSNGNSLWSRGPPASDAVMMVSYVKAYFNSSLESRQHDLAARCQDPAAPKAICPIPDQRVAPDPDGQNGNVTANTHFFSYQQNSTNNQTVFQLNRGVVRGTAWPVIFISVLVFLLTSSAMRL